MDDEGSRRDIVGYVRFGIEIFKSTNIYHIYLYLIRLVIYYIYNNILYVVYYINVYRMCCLTEYSEVSRNGLKLREKCLYRSCSV